METIFLTIRPQVNGLLLYQGVNQLNVLHWMDLVNWKNHIYISKSTTTHMEVELFLCVPGVTDYKAHQESNVKYLAIGQAPRQSVSVSIFV